MPTEHRTGDLFDQADVEALGHGVNCRGVMGSGIAPLFRAKWPQMYALYRHACLSGQFHLGDVFPYMVALGSGPRWVYNIASQFDTGRNADLAALSKGVTTAMEHAVEHKVRSLALPRIGSGIGGLRWADVSAELERIADGFPSVTLVLVSQPGAQ